MKNFTSGSLPFPLGRLWAADVWLAGWLTGIVAGCRVGVSRWDNPAPSTNLTKDHKSGKKETLGVTPDFAVKRLPSTANIDIL